MHLAERRLAVVGVDQHTVGQDLLAVSDAGHLVGAFFVGTRRVAQFEHLAGRVGLDQLARRTVRDDAALIHHDEPVAQLLGLVHVVGRQHERHAALLESVEAVPQHVPRLGVEAGGRFVEQHQLGLVDERSRDGHPPLHATGERLDLAARAFGQLHELEQLGRTTLALGPRDVEVAAVEDQVVDHRQLLVELIELGHDTHPGPDLLAVGRRVEAEDVELAVGDR